MSSDVRALRSARGGNCPFAFAPLEPRSCPSSASIFASSGCCAPTRGSPSRWRSPISRSPRRNSSSRCCSAASSMRCRARCRPASAPAARALAPLIGAWVGFGLFIIVAGSAGRLVRRPARAPAPQHGAGGLFRARAAIAARLSCRRAFRPADESHAHRHRHAVVAVAVVLPRAFRRLRLHRRAAAGVAGAELAAGLAADRAVRRRSRC